jgi:hypothetical protein
VTSQLPDQLANPSSSRRISASTSSLPKRAPTGTKTAFPETHLPFLLSKIATLATGNLVYLVQNIYEELRVYGVKKNAIEGKIREIGEKSKEKKIWIVKDDFAVSEALTFLVSLLRYVPRAGRTTFGLSAISRAWDANWLVSLTRHNIIIHIVFSSSYNPYTVHTYIS